MTDSQSQHAFRPILDALIAPLRDELALRIANQPGLQPDERGVVAAVADAAVRSNAERKLNRVLLLELHAAKLSGQLTSADDPSRFAEFVRLALREEFAPHLRQRYPALHGRLERALAQQADAIVTMVERLVADRAMFAGLPGAPHGDLLDLQLGEGDVHNKGNSVARLVLSHGSVMYKPRSLAVDAALDRFLAEVAGADDARIRVPQVIDRGDYGWAGYVDHRYCTNDDDIATFYRNLGRWLAVMRLLGGTDLHHENIIAVGPVPMAIDVESLFAAEVAAPPSGLGHAVDLAAELIRASVLRTGLVPFRAPALGLGGVDISAAGALPGEQPKIRIPMIVEDGTTSAHLEMLDADLPMAKNHPTPNPDVSRNWDYIVAGFLDFTRHLQRIDAEGRLATLMSAFDGCTVRDIRRPTQAYVEIMRMLWHPASLHDEPAAIERARDILHRNAEVVPIAPSLPAEIAAEIEDMRYGDIPVFSSRVDRLRLDEVLDEWRGMRIELEELTIRGALVTVYLNGRLNSDDRGNGRDLIAARPHGEALDARRRSLAARTLERLLHLSVRGSDGTMTWVSPVLGDNGWAMRSLQSDMYIGLGGIAVALGGYLHETRHRRADAVDGSEDALAGVLKVLRATEDDEPIKAVGGFIGLGSQVLTWLNLHTLQAQPELLQRAISRAQLIERRGFEQDQVLDLLEGVSGAIVPLLQLAEVTRDERWLSLAAKAGCRLEAAAICDERGARWPSAVFSEPLGGFAHGATGSGWALARLAMSGAGSQQDQQRWQALAARAFDFEESLYDTQAGNWIDVRKPLSRDFPDTWCHGSVGIGLAACDLYARSGDPRQLDLLRRAVGAAARGGWGISHTLCHGDLSLWELLTRAAVLDPGLADREGPTPAARVISSIEEHHGAVGGLARDAFTPGLMSGVSGSIHLLNRMHPHSRLASPLLLESREVVVARPPERAADRQALQQLAV